MKLWDNSIEYPFECFENIYALFSESIDQGIPGSESLRPVFGAETLYHFSMYDYRPYRSFRRVVGKGDGRVFEK